MRIVQVTPESPAARLGFLAGDQLLTMNGERVRDELDFHFVIEDESVVFRVERDGRDPFTIEYARHPLDGEFGVRLEDPKVRLCGNDCIFCFVDQSPKGMRSSVYVRDEDYRLSFLYGNFVTLTNLKEWEIRRILRQRLSPLYVSVHSLDPEIRRVLFGTDRAIEILPKMDRLLDAGIELHTQIVLCPGFNDGDDLPRTIDGLGERVPRGIQSIAVVPVGLTHHRENLPQLKPVTPETAREVYEQVLSKQQAFRRETGRGIVYLADEWYRLLDLDPPPHEEYDGYPQLEDGIGLTRHFLHHMALEGTEILHALRGQGLARLTVVTGELFHPTLHAESERLMARVPGVTLDVVPVRNEFFGTSVTVAGLLAGRDITAQLEGRTLGQRVCVPPVSVNADGRFIDDLTLDEVRSRLDVDVVAGWGVGPMA
jgi:putative radical SAM enzyme (TIGR03279 family)